MGKVNSKFWHVLILLGLFTTVLGSATVAAATAIGDNPGPVAGPIPAFYACRVILVAKDLVSGSAEFQYQAVGKGASTHGGQEYTFTSGDHSITTLSTSRWMGITWTYKGQVVTETITARGDDNQSSQVLIVYNPKDTDEQVALDCSPAP